MTRAVEVGMEYIEDLKIPRCAVHGYRPWIHTGFVDARRLRRHIRRFCADVKCSTHPPELKAFFLKRMRWLARQ